MKLLIIMLLSINFKGDNANSVGIREALIKQYSAVGAKIQTDNIDIKKSKAGVIDTKFIKDSFINKVQDFDEIIVVGAGIDGIEAFKAIAYHNEKSKFIWTGHQFVDELRNNLKILDFVILPSYALNEEQKQQIEQQSILILTEGIPTNTSKEDILKTYDKALSNNTIVAAENGYILVIMSGDAPDESGKINFYTADEAKRLGNYVAKIAKKQNMVVLAINGPRTGQYNPHTGEKKCWTREDSFALDEVSEIFLNILKKSGLKEQNIMFSNYADAKESELNLFLGAVLKNEKSVAIIGGDSASKVSLAIELLKPGQVYIEKGGSMSKVHNLHLDYVLKQGWAKLLTLNENELKPFKTKVVVKSNAEIAGEQILENDHNQTYDLDR